MRKPILYVGAALGFIMWDLLQAHSNIGDMYRAFMPNAETKAVSAQAATVSIVRSNDPALSNPCGTTDEGITFQTINQMVRRAIYLVDPTGLRSIIKSGDTVLIKPNIVQQDSSGSGGVTDIRVVKALVMLIDSIDHGHIKIIVGDGSPRPFTTFEKNSGTGATAWKALFDVPGYQILKTEAIAAGIDFRLSNLNGNSDTNPWAELDTVTVPGGGQAQPQGGMYFIHRDVVRASVYITVPVAKIHKDTRYTGALKNQIGLAASSRYGFNKMSGVTQDGRTHTLRHASEMAATWHNWQDKEIVDLAVSAKIRFALVDAITSLDSTKTPNYNKLDNSSIKISNRVKMNTIVAGFDPVAVDNVCCRIMSVNPDDIRHITLAERVGLGTNDPAKITVVGCTIEQARRLFRYAQPFGTTNTCSYGQSNRTWLLSGLFPTAGITDPMNHEFVANEAAAAPVAGSGTWSQPIYFTDDQILLNQYYTTLGSQTAVSYAFSYFTAPSAVPAELWVGSDEAVKIFLNGEVVYNYTGIRTFAGNEFYKDIIPITVRQGSNRLLVKSYQSTGKYSFSLNICEIQANQDFKGNRVAGLKFSTEAGVTSVPGGASPTASTFALNNSYPNPFNPSTQISFSLGVTGFASLKIYDISGREVATLMNEQTEAGRYTIAWNASHCASGIYFCRLVSGGRQAIQKIVLVR
jgi:uncharacterized protein (DUF362 family)